ncbi:hypothetical protein ABEX47_07040 [Paenibacillus ehimensis]|uniref:hypothetical protein n=1 Tax=Paenibacillus ehimensis TaxID=79264 RepID=UPI000FDB0144|nr:hypothetical protein [Paenibacillus ehimensis]
MKRKFSVGILVLVLFLSSAMPVFAAKWYEDWSFTMKRRVVTGVERKLQSGALTITGKIFTDGNSYPRITVAVYKSVTGPDDYIGSFDVRPTGEEFSEYIGEISAGNYYLEISRNDYGDGSIITGEGKFVVQR